MTASFLTPSHMPRWVVCGVCTLCKIFMRRMSVGPLVCMRAHLAEVITERDDRNSWLLTGGEIISSQKERERGDFCPEFLCFF